MSSCLEGCPLQFARILKELSKKKNCQYFEVFERLVRVKLAVMKQVWTLPVRQFESFLQLQSRKAENCFLKIAVDTAFEIDCFADIQEVLCFIMEQIYAGLF